MCKNHTQEDCDWAATDIVAELEREAGGHVWYETESTGKARCIKFHVGEGYAGAMFALEGATWEQLYWNIAEACNLMHVMRTGRI